MARTALVPLLLLVASVTAAAQTARPSPWVDRSPHKEGFVNANGVRLHYLDWGGRGDAVVFLTGMGASPHLFDDLAPKFTDRHRVLGLTRRGLVPSDRPDAGYDTQTLTEDLRRFLDALKIERATLVGWSLAGTEMTRFATLYPSRASRLVYLDAAYDYAGLPDIWAKDPVAQQPSKDDLASFDAARRWFTRTFGFWSDAVEADARAINLQPDGTMKLEAMTPNVTKQLMEGMVSARPDFTKVKAPILAFYAVSRTHPFLPANADAETRRKAQSYWGGLFLPAQRAQIARLRTDAPAARVVELEGAQHLCFIRPRDEVRVVRETRAFLSAG